MQNTSKGRVITAIAPVSNGAPSQILSYNANPVTFRTIDGALMVNATQMAKPFGKRSNDWLKLSHTKAFIFALANARGKIGGSISPCGKRKRLSINALKGTEFIVTQIGGGNGGGTYFHEDIAIEFARWLSPAFAVWCNDRIKELFRQSVTHPQPQEQPQPQAITIDDVLGRLREATDLLTMLKQERAERERLEAVLSGIKRQIDGLPPKSERMVITQSTLFTNL